MPATQLDHKLITTQNEKVIVAVIILYAVLDVSLK